MSRQRHRVDVTTDGAGNFSGAVASASGYVERVRYVPDGSVPLLTGADLTIAGATTGLPIMSVTDIGTSAISWNPRQATHTTLGAASFYRRRLRSTIRLLFTAKI